MLLPTQHSLSTFSNAHVLHKTCDAEVDQRILKIENGIHLELATEVVAGGANKVVAGRLVEGGAVLGIALLGISVAGTVVEGIVVAASVGAADDDASLDVEGAAEVVEWAAELLKSAVVVIPLVSGENDVVDAVVTGIVCSDVVSEAPVVDSRGAGGCELVASGDDARLAS